MRKTKIVATIGPASQDHAVLQQLINGGLDVARLNFSHGTHEQHGRNIDDIREIRDDVAIMLDTQGPEIRLGVLEQPIELREGMSVRLTTDDRESDKPSLPVTYPDFLQHIREGDTILLDDGNVGLVVESIDHDAVCTVRYGGTVTSQQSVNVPGRDLDLKAPTEKDRADIRFGIEKDVDFVAASFVESAGEVREIRKLLRCHGSQAGVISKIESMRALENIDAIIAATDGVMVARGDLGVEIPASDVPLTQKNIIKKCNERGTPVITATQMLESMTEHPRATRAEASDVANAVLDGTDAVMLSEETAVGSYPVEAFTFMAEVLEKVETFFRDNVHWTVESGSHSIADIICKNVWQVCNEIPVDYIVAHTSSGSTARNISKYRPMTDIIAFTNSRVVQRQLRLVWGVRPYYIAFQEYFDDLIHDTTSFLKQQGHVTDDDILVITAGVPNSVTGITNLMEIRQVSSLLDG
ncbi:MAG: pyruvate kinase [Thermoplasmatota archaeon]